jgi:hypothetical protein
MPFLSTNLFENIVRYIVVGHRVIHPVIDIKPGVTAETVRTFRAVPKSPKPDHRFIQANAIVGAKGVPFPFSVDGISLFSHGETLEQNINDPRILSPIQRSKRCKPLNKTR